VLGCIGKTVAIFNPSPESDFRLSISEQFQQWRLENDWQTLNYIPRPCHFRNRLALVWEIFHVASRIIFPASTDAKVFSRSIAAILPIQSELYASNTLPISYLSLVGNSRGANESSLHCNQGLAINFVRFSHSEILIDANGGEYSRENHNYPISKTAAFNRFAESHRGLLFLASIVASRCGVFWLIFGGYQFVAREPDFVYLLLCLLADALAFALVFTFAHASYS
jgi:hypothetical protein